MTEKLPKPAFALGEPVTATVVYGHFKPRIVQGHIWRPVLASEYGAPGWHFDSEQISMRLYLRETEEGLVWSRGHHDGKDLLAACKLVWSAPR